MLREDPMLMQEEFLTTNSSELSYMNSKELFLVKKNNHMYIVRNFVLTTFT